MYLRVKGLSADKARRVSAPFFVDAGCAANALTTLAVCLLRCAAGKTSDVKLCYTMRGALQLLDFDDPSIADMKRLLLRAAFAPTFLTKPEVRAGDEVYFGMKNFACFGRAAAVCPYGNLHVSWVSCSAGVLGSSLPALVQ